MMYSVSSELYLEVAARLAEAIGGGSYFSGSLTFPFGDMECRLTASVIVYRRRERLPEGDRDAIADLVPVWWEFHTVGRSAERLLVFRGARAPLTCRRAPALLPRHGAAAGAHPDKKPARRGAAHGFFKKIQ